MSWAPRKWGYLWNTDLYVYWKQRVISEDSEKNIRKIFFCFFSPETCQKHFHGGEGQLVKLHQRLLVIGYSQEPLRKDEHFTCVCIVFVHSCKWNNRVLLHCHKEIFIICLTIGIYTLPVSTKKQLDHFSNIKQESLQTITRSFSNSFFKK